MTNGINYELRKRSLSFIVSLVISLQIVTSTWQKDSHGLFDYESDIISQRKFKIEGSCKMFRNEKTSQIQIISISDARRGRIPMDCYFLNSVNVEKFPGCDETVFSMSVPENNTSSKTDINFSDPYLIVRSLKSKEGYQKGFFMDKGDIIKLGRMEFMVLEYKDDKRTYSLRETAFLDNQNSTYVAPDQLISGSCKFCLLDETSQQNYLVSPCQCKGSCLMVHVYCLRSWIDSKIKKQPNGISTQYNFTKFNCELCGIPFPLKIIRKGVETQMFKIEKPTRPYIVLESLTEGRADGEKILHLIAQPEKGETIKLGRGHSCQIRMSDISVSRIHAHIMYKDKKFVLYDNHSKFGTLVRMTKSTRFTNELVAMQVGRTVLAFNIKSEISGIHKLGYMANPMRK